MRMRVRRRRTVVCLAGTLILTGTLLFVLWPRPPRLYKVTILPPLRPCYMWDPQRGKISLDEQLPGGLATFFWPHDLSNTGGIVGVLVSNDLRCEQAVLLEPIGESWEK